MKRWVKPFVPVRLRRWFRHIFPHEMIATDERYGCRMLSARSVESESARHAIIEKVRSLGPWFHNFEIATVSGPILPVDFPAWISNGALAGHRSPSA
jgi:hypothetical protein